MLSKKHILIYILIAGILFALPACSDVSETQVSTTAASTRSSNFKAPDFPENMEHEPPQGMGFDISNEDIFEKGYYAVQYDSFEGAYLYWSTKNNSGSDIEWSVYLSDKELSEDEINAKVKEAEQYAEEVKKRKEEVEVKNQAETLIYETEKNVKELDQALSEEEKNDINAAKDALQSALNAGNIDDIKAKTEALTEKFHTISAKMYQQAQQAGGAGPQGTPGPDMSGMSGMGAGPGAAGAGPQSAPSGDDNVVDADFEVVDDDENK